MTKMLPLLKLWSALLLVMCPLGINVSAQEVSLNTLGRFDGWRENSLIGYGLVTGLSGSGDSRRNAVTRQALRNVLGRLGTTITDDQINSRNVAVVLVTAILPASANVGDKIDVSVSSIGDARSLAGGTLIMTPLLGADQRAYALAQGALVTGGYAFESNLNVQQRNFPTAAVLPGGATVESAVDASILADGEIGFLLHNPSFGTAERIADAINRRFGWGTARVKNADEVRIAFSGGRDAIPRFAALLEALIVEPVRSQRIVLNERSGLVVAGGDVMISSTVIAQGDLRITVKSENYASQPGFISGFANDIRSLIVTNTSLDVGQAGGDTVVEMPNASVADLVQALAAARVDTRRIISILQAMKAAGALHADIVVQ